MKLSKVTLMSVIVLLIAGLAFSAGAAPPGGWPNNKGEIYLEILDGAVVTGTLNLFSMKLGDGHYLVLGRNIEPAEVVPFIGAAEIVTTASGPMVRIHATASGVMPAVPPADPGEVHGGLATVMLNPVTLEGTLENLDLMSLKDNSYYKVEYGGSKVLRPCGQ